MARKHGLRLSLVCAILLFQEAWRQEGWLDSMADLQESLQEYGLHEGVARFTGNFNGEDVFAIMRYLQAHLNID